MENRGREKHAGREESEMAASAAISPTGGEVKDLYEMGEIPPLGHVPAKM